MRNIDPKFQEYIFEVSGALGFFQLIEQFLKLYIKYSFKHAAVYLSGKMYFRFTGEEFEDAPWGRLLNTFCKLNDNNEVVGVLKKLKKERDFCAHRAFVWYLKKDQRSHEEKLKRIKEIKREALNGFFLLFIEVSKLDERIMGKVAES